MKVNITEPVSFSSSTDITDLSISTIDSKNFIMSWEDTVASNHQIIGGQISDSGVITLGSSSVIGTGMTYLKTAPLNSTQSIVTYRFEDSCYARVVTKSSDNEISVSQSYYLFSSGGGQIDLNVSRIDESRFAVVWHNSSTDNGEVVIGKISSDSSISFGSNYIFQSNNYIAYPNVSTLSENKIVISWLNALSGENYSVIGIIESENQIVFGSNYEFNTFQTFSDFITTIGLSDKHFLIMWDGATNYEARIGTINNNDEIEFGPINTFKLDDDVNGFRLTKVDPLNFLVAWENGTTDENLITHGKISLSGDIIFNDLESFVTTTDIQAIALSSFDYDKFLIAYENTTTDENELVGVLAPSEDIVLGQTYIYEPDSEIGYVMEFLDEEHFVSAWDDGGTEIIAKIGTISKDGTLTWGTEYLFESVETMQFSSMIALDSTHFVLAWQDSNAGLNKIIVGTVSNGSDISFGSVYYYDTDLSQHLALTALDSTHFVLSWADYDYINTSNTIADSKIGTVTNGNQISFGSPVNFDWFDGMGDLQSVKLSDTKFVVVWEQGDNGLMKIGTVTNGNQISFGSETTFEDQGLYYIGLAEVDETHFVMAWGTGTLGETVVAVVEVIDNNTVNIGYKYTIENGTPRSMSMSSMGSNQFVLSWQLGSEVPKVIVGNVKSNYEIEFTKRYSFDDGTSWIQLPLAAGHGSNFAIAWRDSTNSSDREIRVGKVLKENVANSLFHVLDNPNINTTSNDDQFSYGADISGNYAVITSSREYDETGAGSGVAYVFDVQSSELVHTLTNPNSYPSSGDSFGFSCAIDGDYIAIGTPYEDSSTGTDAGVVHIYDTTSGSLIDTIIDPNAYGTDSNDVFGARIALSGGKLIANSFNEGDSGGAGSGKVYIFDITTRNLLHTLDNPNAYDTSAGDNFGYNVDICEDYAIVGAAKEDDTGGEDSGKAYIFDTTTGNLLHTLDNPNAYDTSASDGFGYAVCITNTYAAVSADWEDDEYGTDSGKVYVFDTVSGNLTYTIDNPVYYTPSTDDRFGRALFIDEDLLYVSATGADSSTHSNSGRVYIFDLITGLLYDTINNPNAYGTSQDDQFGFQVKVDDKYILVSAHLEDDSSDSDSGKAYIFKKKSFFEVILSSILIGGYTQIQSSIKYYATLIRQFIDDHIKLTWS